MISILEICIMHRDNETVNGSRGRMMTGNQDGGFWEWMGGWAMWLDVGYCQDPHLWFEWWVLRSLLYYYKNV